MEPQYDPKLKPCSFGVIFRLGKHYRECFGDQGKFKILALDQLADRTMRIQDKFKILT
jgi:hypothetical protein